MGKIKKAAPLKLFCSFFYRDAQAFQKAKEMCGELFGGVDFESQKLSFSHTEYYEKEFGAHLLRNFISFENLIVPDVLAEIKIKTNEIEEKLKQENNRRVNIDPGYIALSKLVLATTKDYYHRIYLAHGIYAEATLYYKDRTFQGFPWTYPDYKTPEIISIFNHIRGIYRLQLDGIRE